MTAGAGRPGEWFSVHPRRQPDGRILDCVLLVERPVTSALLVDGIVELVSCLQDIAASPRGPEHAGVAVVFGLRDDDPEAAIALAAVRGFVLSVAQELGSSLRLNLVVHRAQDEGIERDADIEPTLDYLADPLSAFVHAATLAVGGLSL